jgi:DNA-binding beta-propeller fold protein YncE
MSKSRDIADSAATINFIDNLTSDAQTQLNTLDTAVDNISVTSGTLTKTFAQDEVATITLSSSITTPVVSVTKEVPQTGTTNNSWDVNSTSENYTRLDSAPATTLSWVADLANTSYDNKSYTPSQDNNCRGIVFNPDGTKMYVLGEDNDNIFQYTLSTAYDVTTASYYHSLNVTPQDVNGWQIAFNNNGTSIYFVGVTNNSVYQYDLTTAYDLSTASYASKSFSFSTQEGSPRGLAFNSDGTKMYTVGTSNDTVYQYSLSTAYDVSTASYDSVSFSVSSQDPNPIGLQFNSDGTKMYILGSSNYTIFQYSLSTGFDISTASYDSVSYNYNSVSGAATFGFTFNADFTKLFVATATSGNIYQFSLPKKLSLGTGSFASADVGKTIEANSGVFVLTSTAGAYSETTAPTSYAQVASGSWEMYAVVYNTTDGDLQLSGGLLNQGDISTASFNQSEDVSARGSTLIGLTFKPDGTFMYVTFDSNNDCVAFQLTTAWDISTASYATYFGFGGQDSTPAGIAFNNDGTRIYMVGYAGQDINEYDLSTAYSVNTASYSRNFSVSSQTTQPYDIKFNSDGTKMFVTDNNNIRVLEYALSTAFRVDNATFTQAFSLSSQMTNAYGLAFNSDGTKMYVSEPNDIFQYTLSTGFDISTASYSGKTKNISANVSTPTALFLKSDEQNIFIADYSGTDVNDYSIGTEAVLTGYHAVHTKTSTDTTYWTDINSMTADEAAGDGSIFYCVSTDDRSTWKIAHNTDGIRSIVRNNSGTWQYNSNGTYSSETWTNATTNTELNALQEAMEGASLATNTYDLSYATASQVFSVSSEELAPRDIEFNTDGTKMFVLGAAGQDVNEYTLTTGFDVSTASFVDSFSIASQDTNPQGLAFNNDGTKMYVTGEAGDDVNQYNLSTGFDVSSATYSQNFSVAGQDSVPTGLAFNADGTKMFVVGEAGQDINEYSLTTGFDISTASYSQNFSLSSEDAAPCGLAFNSDGTKMFIVGRASAEVNQYTLTTGFDVSTASFASKTLSVTSQESTPHGITFNSDGSKMYIIGTNGDEVNEYTVGSTSYPNQMNKTQLDSVSDANHFTLANDLDLGIIFSLSSGTTVPSSDGVSINYDANVLNKGAILGTDYDFDAPAATKVRITALAANNLKVRVV